MRGADVIRVLIADEIARIVGDLEKLEPYGDLIDVCGVAHQASAVIEESGLRQPDVLLLHEHFSELPSADIAAHLRSVSPATRVLLMTAGQPRLITESWIAGAVAESAEGAELLEALQVAGGVLAPGGVTSDATRLDDAATPVEPEQPDLRARRGRSQVVVAFSGKGGTGTSMVATNLAVTLAGDARGRAVLVDVDLQFGDAAGMLHVEDHQLSIADLLTHGDDIEGALLESVLATGPAEVGVLRAPTSPEVAETIDAADLRSIIRATALSHEFVVVDTPSCIDERVLETFELADRVLLVTSYNLSAVRGTRATLLLLEALGVDPARVDVVLNHTRPRTNYRREDIEEILGRTVLVDLPYDPRVDPSLDSGTPIVVAQPRAELARRLVALAQLMAVPAGANDAAGAEHVELPAPTPPVYRRRFSLGRR
ncbi:MAG TPA: P-loop NTPase [Candidatus Saccharimonadales bacterium]|nr:P-loop NTPase [Candidatus Saccharimonadales bacterium]